MTIFDGDEDAQQFWESQFEILITFDYIDTSPSFGRYYVWMLVLN
jgi:hypothetical protein